MPPSAVLELQGPLVHYDLGVALEKKGDRQGALLECRAGLGLNPHVPPIARPTNTYRSMTKSRWQGDFLELQKRRGAKI